MSRAAAYLTFPPHYAASMGGARWAHGGDAVEDAAGDTLLLFDELAELLAGAFAAPPPPHLVHLLTAYRRLKAGGDGFDPASAAFHAARRVPGTVRNAGRLLAHLLDRLPRPPDPPAWADLERELHRLRRDGERRRPELAVEPPVGRELCEVLLRAGLTRIGPEAVAHWLRHGGGPTAAGRPLAEPLAALPVRVAEALALGTPRLAGARRLVPALDAALTLPARPRKADRVPQGGYADVSTRGNPDQLLPSQFALDPDEFVRRFAERELLFFQREEPHRPTPAGRLLVLDQGVRAWGRVRLALAAAVAVLLGKDPAKAGVVALAVTSAGPVDLDAVTPQELADHLGASDLSPHPADCLRTALDGPAVGPRDVVLFTHPRAAREPAVHDAADGRRAGDRLFALTVADDGRAELVQWQAGGPVAVRTFRLDLTATDAPPPAPPRPVEGEWAGDREPVGFPFRPGLVGEPAACGLDAAGERLVVVTREGVPQVLTAGGPPEVLPRAVRAGRVLRDVEAVLGVRGGVVVCGRLDLPGGWFVTVRGAAAPVMAAAAGERPARPADQPRLVAAHYDFAARTVRLHDFGQPPAGGLDWTAHPDLHCVAVRSRTGGGTAVDLDTGRWSVPHADIAAGGREVQAWERPGAAAPVRVAVHTDPLARQFAGSPTLLVAETGLELCQTATPWGRFSPSEDGRPLFEARPPNVVRAELAGNLLAVRRTRANKPVALHLFSGPRGDAVCTLPLTGAGLFALNADGTRVGIVEGPAARLLEVADAGAEVATVRRAGLHNGLDVSAAAGRLHVAVGTFAHTFEVRNGRLAHAVARRESAPGRRRAAAPVYDSQRFRPAGDVTGWAVWADQLGQVVLLDATGRPQLAVLVRRDKAAAWAAGGTFWGDPALIGATPTPDADRLLAAAWAGDAP